jgi:hypothetical protein
MTNANVKLCSVRAVQVLLCTLMLLSMSVRVKQKSIAVETVSRKIVLGGECPSVSVILRSSVVVMLA